MAILEKMDPITNAVFETHLRRENVYHSSRFRAEDFPPKTELTVTDTVRLLGELLTPPRGIHQAGFPRAQKFSV
jgi:hypothetical protein